MSSSISTLAVTGFMLGWSVAWPPGPINAEAIRRGLTGRMRAAYLVVLGGCTGDAIWALLVGLGTSTLLHLAGLEKLISAISVALLLLLAALFFRGGRRRYSDLRAGRTRRRPSVFDGSRRGFLLGLSLALTGPWNVAFWLAVMGQAADTDTGLAGAAVTAAGVLAGAATWGLVLCGGVAHLGVRFARPSWEIFTQFATGALMVAFAVHTAMRLLGA